MYCLRSTSVYVEDDEIIGRRWESYGLRHICATNEYFSGNWLILVVVKFGNEKGLKRGTEKRVEWNGREGVDREGKDS